MGKEKHLKPAEFNNELCRSSTDFTFHLGCADVLAAKTPPDDELRRIATAGCYSSLKRTFTVLADGVRNVFSSQYYHTLAFEDYFCEELFRVSHPVIIERFAHELEANKDRLPADFHEKEAELAEAIRARAHAQDTEDDRTVTYVFSQTPLPEFIHDWAKDGHVIARCFETALKEGFATVFSVLKTILEEVFALEHMFSSKLPDRSFIDQKMEKRYAEKAQDTLRNLVGFLGVSRLYSAVHSAPPSSPLLLLDDVFKAFRASKLKPVPFLAGFYCRLFSYDLNPCVVTGNRLYDMLVHSRMKGKEAIDHLAATNLTCRQVLKQTILLEKKHLSCAMSPADFMNFQKALGEDLDTPISELMPMYRMSDFSDAEKAVFKAQRSPEYFAGQTNFIIRKADGIKTLIVNYCNENQIASPATGKSRDSRTDSK